MQALLDFVRRHKAGDPVGITAVCSAHPVVLEAALTEGARTGAAVLIEATSNQVNQFGGYTGMRPADFHAEVTRLARALGAEPDQLLLGGDHLDLVGVEIELQLLHRDLRDRVICPPQPVKIPVRLEFFRRQMVHAPASCLAPSLPNSARNTG